MFASNQILKISGPLDREHVYSALDFALKYSGAYTNFTRTEKPSECVYQITADNAFCIGWAWNKAEKGWQEFPFDFDTNIIAEIIINHLLKQDIKYGEWDGSYQKGFLMTAIEMTFADEKDGIKKPFCGIVKFEPFTCFYAK